MYVPLVAVPRGLQSALPVVAGGRHRGDRVATVARDHDRDAVQTHRRVLNLDAATEKTQTTWAIITGQFQLACCNQGDDISDN